MTNESDRAAFEQALSSLADEIERCAGNNNADYHRAWAKRLRVALTLQRYQLIAEQDEVEIFGYVQKCALERYQSAELNSCLEIWKKKGQYATEPLYLHPVPHADRAAGTRGGVSDGANITREQATDIAVAWAKAQRPSYYSEPFTPHAWVIDAIMYAADLAAGNTEMRVTSEDVQRAHAVFYRHPDGSIQSMRAALESFAATRGLAVGDVPDSDLIQRCREVSAWRNSGTLNGDALRAYAKNAPEYFAGDELQWAEMKTTDQALDFVAAAKSAPESARGDANTSPSTSARVPDELPALDPVELHAKGEMATERQIGYNEGWNACRDAMLAAAPKPNADGMEMSPDFTDSARAAIAWVLYHHQGGSSPIGQPLRFALGIGAHERLQDWRIAEAKRWAAWAGANTEQFHRARSAASQPEAQS